MTEKEKMLAGLPYQGFEEELLALRQRAKEILFEVNGLRPGEIERRHALLRGLLGSCGTRLFVEPPFRCDYGCNLRVGENFYANYGLVVLDCAPVTVGDDVLFGPNVSLFTAGHPLHHEPRTQGLEYALPISIGHRVWIGGGSIVNPGVTIGDRSVIGSGSVVTHDIPADVLAVGNPCRVLRPITEADRERLLPAKASPKP